jgi:hypothetical protein
MENLQQRLIGAWEMIDWKIINGNELIEPPLGPIEKCGGILIYSENGLMCSFISVKNPLPFKEDHIGGGTLEEKARANSEIMCYSGSYTFDEASSTVTHKVSYANSPNMVGKELPRICIFEGDTLKLDTPPMDFGEGKRGSYIVWRRAKR